MTRWWSGGLSRRRQITGFCLAAILIVTATVTFATFDESIHDATALSCYLLVVVIVAAVGGLLPSLCTAVVAPVVVNWFLIEPVHTLSIANREDVVSLGVFVAVAAISSWFVAVAAQRTTDASRARADAASLARLAADARVSDPLQAITDHVREAFDLERASVHVEGEDGVVMTVAASGSRPAQRATGTAERRIERRIELGVGSWLTLEGPVLGHERADVLHSFTAQVTTALEQRRLSDIAGRAEALQASEALRNAILQAVSHDLRTPLAAIKASVSSLRDDEVVWPPDVESELLASIEEHADRLTRIVTNLLDLTRLQSGVLTAEDRAFTIEEVVPAAVRSVGDLGDDVEVAVADGLPDALGDPALTERALANLLGNAIQWSPRGRPVSIGAAACGDRIELRVVDHGPGIDRDARALVVQPFQRLGDGGPHKGLGLGLAIADRFTRAMGGELDRRETSGGGLTAVLSLRATRR
jgi:two-component system, OmpR family, sensor histidine kinase KdpD